MAAQSNVNHQEIYKPVCLEECIPDTPERLEDFIVELENMKEGGFKVDYFPDHILQLYGGSMNGLDELSMSMRGRPLTKCAYERIDIADMIDLVREYQQECEEKARRDSSASGSQK